MTTSEIQDCAAWIKKLCIILVIKGTHLPISTCDSKYAGNATVFHMYWDGKSRVCRNCNYINFEHAFWTCCISNITIFDLEVLFGYVPGQLRHMHAWSSGHHSKCMHTGT